MKHLSAALLLGVVVACVFTCLPQSAFAATNVVPNATLETANGTSPVSWLQGKWGTITAVFTYPAAGKTGNGAKLQVTKYTSGDAKWYFTPVAVTPNTSYTVADDYQATVASMFIVQVTSTTGTNTYIDLGSVAASTGWIHFSKTFTTPANAASVTVFHGLQKVGTLSLDNMSLTSNAATSTVPQTKPVISSFTASPTQITAGQTSKLSWSVTDATSLSISPSVGSVVGTSTSVMPTATTTYTLTAANAAGTSTAQTTVNVTPVVVVTPPTATNLVPNPSFAVGTTQGAGTVPKSWSSGAWGAASAAVFTYPVAGTDDNFAAQVSIPTYSAIGLDQGAADWYFANVAVTGGSLYTFSNWYKSDASSYVIAQWTLSNNTVAYDAIATLPPTNGTWKNSSHVFSVPSNAVSVSIFQQLQSVGTLTVDNFSLTLGATNQSTLLKAVVSLTFDDGWQSQYVNAAPILKAANMGATFYIITDKINTSTIYDFFADPNQSIGATKTTTTSNWSPIYTDPTVQTLLFADTYTAASASTVTASYISGGSTISQTIGTLPAGTGTASLIFTLPKVSGKTVSPITIVHESSGTLTTSNPSLVAYDFGYMTLVQMLALRTAGHELASHTVAHSDLVSETFAQVTNELVNSRSRLVAWGASPIDSLAYPLGNYSQTIESQAASAGYVSARAVDIGYNTKTTDKFALKSNSIIAATPFSVVQSWIDTAVANKLWLILTFHDVDTQDIITMNGEVFGTTPAILQQIVNYLASKQASGSLQVKTMHDALPLVQ